MQKMYKTKRRTIAYIMVLLLLINLLSGSAKGVMVRAAGDINDNAVTDENGEGENNLPNYKVTFRDLNEDSNASGSSEGNAVVSNKGIEIECVLDDVEGYNIYSQVVVKDEAGNTTSSQVSLDFQETEGEGQKKATVTYTAEKDKVLYYSVTFWLQDENGGIEGTEETHSFILDSVAPVVSVATNYKQAQRYYDKVSYSAKAEDRGDDDCDVVVSGTRVCMSENGEITTTQILEKLTEDEPEITFEENGNYEIYAIATDDAGNKTTTEPITFSIDFQAPVLSILGVEDGVHYNRDVSLTFSLKDLNVDEEEDSYKVEVTKDNEVQSCPVTLRYEDYEGLSKESVTYTEGGVYHVTFSGKDSNGNEATKELSFVIDKIAPTARLAISYDNKDAEPLVLEEETDEGEKTVYYLDDSAKLSFDVSEKFFENAEVYVGIVPQNGESGEKKFSMVNNPDTIECVCSQEDDYKAYVWARDAAGNYVGKDGTTGVLDASYSCYFVIDSTAPVFDIQGVEGDNPFCSEGVQLTLSADDRHHDLSTYTIEITKTDNKGTVTKEYYIGKEGWNYRAGSTDIVEKVLTFTEEGNYTVTISGKDKVGNEGETVSKKFRIDKTSPVITLSSVEEGKYYSDDVSFSAMLQELNYSEADAKVQVIRQLGQETEDTTETLDLKKYSTSFTLNYTKEGSYTIYVTAKDGAGNVAETQTVHFVIDKTAPQLAINGVTDGSMTREAVSVELSARDYNHDFSRYRLTVVRSDADDELENEVYVYEEAQWLQTGTIATKQLQFSKEGKYQLVFEAKDKAGNVAETKQLTFYIDATAPVISGVIYSDSNGVIGEKYHNIYSNKAILVEFTVKDQVVGVDDSKVYVTVGKPEEKNDSTQMYIAHKTVGNSYYVYVPTDLKLSEFDNVITIWANDVLNNESSYKSTNLIFNTSKPAISMDCDVDYSKWTNQDVTFHTTVEDSKSGIKKIVYKINNKVVKTVTFKELVNSYSYDLTATETAAKSTGYNVTVEATNNCGTEHSVQKRVYIDKVKPAVTLSGVEKGTHYNSNQTFTTSVKDVSYENTKTVYVITRTLDGKQTNMSAAAFHSKKIEDSCSRKMIREGKYKIYAVTTDSAGNRSRSNTLTFVIDKTAPKLSITGVSAGAMSGSAVQLTFGCEESFYATNQVTIQVERTLDGKTVEEQITGFPLTAKKASMSHEFAEDGTYRVTMSAKDKAGNVAASQSIVFSVDRTKPEIRITGTGNYEQWNEPATVQFSVEESYYSNNSVEITGTKRDIDGNITEVKLPEFLCTGKVSSLTQTFDEDGVYELEVVSKDEAGNRDSEKIHFTVDRTSPQINGVKEYDGGYYQQFKLADSLEEIFKDLTVITYHMYLNGIEYDGTSTVDEEGKYTLDVEVEDEVGHVSQTTTEFIIDHTAPKVIFSGAGDGETVHEKGLVTLSLTNAEDEITGVRMNGVDYGAETRSLSYTEYGSYQIDVDCVDKAGNAVTRSIYFVYNNPVTDILIFAGMGVLLLSTCGWLWVRTKKKEKEERKHDESSSI